MQDNGSIVAAVGRGTHVLGIVLIVLGALAALAPAITGAPVIMLVGLLLLGAGAVRAVFGWRAWSAGKGPFGVVIGGLAGACGLALLLNPVSTLGAVSRLVAAYMIIDGGCMLLFSSRLDEDGGRTWMWGDAVLSIALGLSMWAGWPLSGLRALGVLVGVKLVSAGIVLLRVERGMHRLSAGVAELRSRLGN